MSLRRVKITRQKLNPAKSVIADQSLNVPCSLKNDHFVIINSVEMNTLLGKNMKAIHVTHKSTDVAHMPRKAAGRPGEYQSGNWVVSRKRARALKGGKIYLHHARDQKSFGGGIITDFIEITPKEKYIRIMFYYEPESKCTGVMAPADGWRNEYRVVK